MYKLPAQSLMSPTKTNCILASVFIQELFCYMASIWGVTSQKESYSFWHHCMENTDQNNCCFDWRGLKKWNEINCALISLYFSCFSASLQQIWFQWTTFGRNWTTANSVVQQIDHDHWQWWHRQTMITGSGTTDRPWSLAVAPQTGHDHWQWHHRQAMITGSGTTDRQWSLTVAP